MISDFRRAIIRDIQHHDLAFCTRHPVDAVVTHAHPAHEAQLLTYLRMSQVRVGLLMNFHAIRLKDGLRRFIV